MSGRQLIHLPGAQQRGLGPPGVVTDARTDSGSQSVLFPYPTQLDLQGTPNETEDKLLGFVARVFLLAMLPHSEPLRDRPFERKSGDVRINLMTPADVGLPHGRYPRLILAWATS